MFLGRSARFGPYRQARGKESVLFPRGRGVGGVRRTLTAACTAAAADDDDGDLSHGDESDVFRLCVDGACGS